MLKHFLYDSLFLNCMRFKKKKKKGEKKKAITQFECGWWSKIGSGLPEHFPQKTELCVKGSFFVYFLFVFLNIFLFLLPKVIFFKY